jgi:hypothetical protein
VSSNSDTPNTPPVPITIQEIISKNQELEKALMEQAVSTLQMQRLLWIVIARHGGQELVSDEDIQNMPDGWGISMAPVADKPNLIRIKSVAEDSP